MSDLDPKKKEFANVYLDNGANATQAVKETYGIEDDNYAGVKGHRLLRNDKVLAFIESQAEGAMSRIAELSMTAENETVKLNANKDIVDRAGYKPVERTDLTSGGKPLILPSELINKNDINTSSETNS